MDNQPRYPSQGTPGMTPNFQPQQSSQQTDSTYYPSMSYYNYGYYQPYMYGMQQQYGFGQPYGYYPGMAQPAGQPIQQAKPQIILNTAATPKTLDPVDDSDFPEGQSRWEQEIKIYSYLYRKLGITIPNIASVKFCKSRPIFSEQSLITVKQYVERAFNKCQSDDERSLMEQCLKNTVTEAKRKSEYYTRDWSMFPLPLLPRENQDFRARTNTLFIKDSQNNLIPKLNQGLPSTSTMLQQTIQSSRFGNPISSSAVPQAQPASSLSNLMTLYDVLKQKQIETINLNHIKKKPLQYSMDFMMLQASRMQPEVTQQLKQQQQQMKRREEEEEKEIDTSNKIIGCCEDLEKAYYRLTGLPDPITIRPENILKKSLALILRKWKDGEVEYDYIVGQFRSIRQDLIVQHIQNDFAVQVYEENARICLECGDFARLIIQVYESCWTMLCDLYELISISENRDINCIGNKVEFDSYRIVYLTMLNKQDQLVKILNSIKDDEKLKLALDIRDAYKSGNFVKLFQLYKTAPETMENLINQFIVRIRVRALKHFIKTKTKIYSNYRVRLLV